MLFRSVQSTIREVFGREYKLKLIEGTTMADWQIVKAQEAKLAELRAAVASQPQPTRPTTSTAAPGWEGVYERISSLYHEIPSRNLPQGKARYASEALYALANEMTALYPENPDDATERSLGRILDRIASQSEMPVVVVAFELERLRVFLKSQAS